MRRLARFSAPFAVAAALALSFAPSTVRGERPAAPELLPQETVLFVSIADAADFKQKFMQTALGQMSQDPQLKPLVDEMYGVLLQTAAAAQESLGVSLGEILDIPQGELTLALVNPSVGEPALVILLDTNDSPAVQKLLDRGVERARQSGINPRTQTVEDVSLTVFDIPGNQARQAAYFQKEGTLAIGTNLEELKKLIGRWNGAEGETLADNKQYGAVMLRSQGSADEVPQLTWFVDPIALVRSIGRNISNAQFAIAILPALGLDGLQCLGGSLTLATEQFDMIVRAHAMIDSPRSGVMEMIALGGGDMTPEKWVPADAATYSTLYWNAEQTYDKLSSLYDSFQTPGAFDAIVQSNVNDRIGVNLEKDILSALEGRITSVSFVQRPITADSQATLFGLRLKDSDAFEMTLDKLVAKFPQAVTSQAYGGVNYHLVTLPQNQQQAQPLGAAPPEWCFAIVEDYLLVANRPAVLERAIIATGGTDSLAESLEFKLIVSRTERQSGGSKPAMLSFQRPAEGFRFFYGLATSEENRARLREQAAEGGIVNSVNQALERNPLPPFEVLEQYLAPGGAILVDDETGLHYTSFTLRRKRE